MVWIIIAFAFIAATIYTLLNVPDYVLTMWRGNRSLLLAVREQLKALRDDFATLERIANSYPDDELQAEIGEVTGYIRQVANPARASIIQMQERAIWNLGIAEDQSWSLRSAEFWNLWQSIWQMRKDVQLIEKQVNEAERYVNILDALCGQLDGGARMPNITPDVVEEPVFEEVFEEDSPYAPVYEPAPNTDSEIQEVATAFKFSLRQESISPVLDQIEGERVQGMQIPKLYERGLRLQQELAELEETAWQEDVPSQTTLDQWLAYLNRWREEKEELANEVEHVQRRRVEHERNVLRVETKIDEFVERKEESDLSELAYDLLLLSDKQIEVQRWENATIAVEIATAITNALPNMDAIDQNARALKQRIPQTAGATRTLLAQAVKRYNEWRTRLEHAVPDNSDMTRWLQQVHGEVTQAVAEKPDIIQLLNEAVIAHRTATGDTSAAASVAQVWKVWERIKPHVKVRDHWIAQALQEMPRQATEIPADAAMQVTIRNRAEKIAQVLEEASAEIQAWHAMTQQDIAGFERDSNDFLEGAAAWECLIKAVKNIHELMDAYKEAYATPQLGWLIEKRDQLHEARQTAIEQIRREMSQLQTIYETLQGQLISLQERLEEVDNLVDMTALRRKLFSAREKKQVSDARMALQQAKYALDNY